MGSPYRQAAGYRGKGRGEAKNTYFSRNVSLPMFLKLTRSCLVFFLLICSLQNYAQVTKTSQQLAALKQQDNLAEWLYVRIDYCNATPQRQAFLLTAQKQAWRQPKNMAEHVAWLTLLTSQGYNQLQMGDILQSINSYEDAYTYFRKYKVVQFDVVEYVLKPLGNNYTRLGDYERAIYIQQKTINSLDEKDNADNIASLYSNIAISYYNMGRYDAAEQGIAKGIKLVKDAQVRFSLNNTLADVSVQKGDLKTAEILLNKNIAPQKNINKETAYGLMGSHTTLGNIQLQTNNLSKAQSEFSTALQLINKYIPGDRVREKAYLIALLGKIYRLQHQPAKALTQFNGALQILRVNTSQTIANIYGENKLVEIFHEKALTYLQLNQPELTLENMRYALLATDKIRKEFADNKTKERLQQEGKELAEEAIEVAYSLFEKTADNKYLNLILEISEQTKARTLADDIQKTYRDLAISKNDTTLRKKLDIERAIAYNERLMMTERVTIQYQKKIDALKFDLALLNKKYREVSTGSVALAGQLLAGLPINAHVMELFFGMRNVYVIEIKSKAVINVNRIVNAPQFREQLTQFIDTYYRNGPAAMSNSPKVFYQTSNAIYTTLFKNIALKKNEKLCIVPDDVLGYLSFDGLITDSRYQPAPSLWPYLIKNVNTTYAFSLNTLIRNKTYSHNQSGFSGLFITHDSANDKPIIAVKKEAAAIEKLVKGDYLYDGEVNIASFFNAFQNSATLHIGTHAYLTGANKEPTLDFGKEKLFLFELLAKPNKPNLVVLSACRTGDGELAKGEGIISLSRGFIAIGTAATISGLWNVNDDAVAQITANMYAGLTNGQSSGTALHNAKLAWLNNSQTSDVLYMPYYWDSLVLMGVDEPAHVEPAIDWPFAAKLFVTFGVVLGMLAGAASMRKRKNLKHKNI
jgi:CHAT domain-containing protein